MVTILFEMLPLCCIIDRRYFCVHAGISPDLKEVGNIHDYSEQIQKVNRFLEIPEQGMLCDLLWSDPIDIHRKEWSFNNVRSCSFFYAKNHANTFLKNNDLQAIIRGH